MERLKQGGASGRQNVQSPLPWSSAASQSLPRYLALDAYCAGLYQLTICVWWAAANKHIYRKVLPEAQHTNKATLTHELALAGFAGREPKRDVATIS